MLVNDKPAIGLYDSGANVSLVNYEFWRKLNLDRIISGDKNIKTISGISKHVGVSYLRIRIGKITKKIPFFIVESSSFKDDILLGLDCIKEFKLCQDQELRITQNNKSLTNLVQNLTETRINFLENIETNNEIKNMLVEYADLFASGKFDVGTIKNYEGAIKLTENKYIAKKPYRCSLQDRSEIEKQIKQLLKAGLIEESSSPYASPVTLVYKKEDGKKSRLCIDYRELNKIVVPESQPFPRIDELMLRARNCRYFTKLDMNSAFWSIPLRNKDKYKTAFVTHHGHWQWNCLPFGLKSSPAIFQRVLASILRRSNLDSFAVNYIDDVLIYSNMYEEHVKHIQLVLEALRVYGFKLNIVKCSFVQDKITYLGHEIGNNCIKPLNNNVLAIKNFPIPRTKKNIRQFLGKLNFYLQYIPKSAVMLEPFHNLLRKNVEFYWSKKCQESFEMVKGYLCTGPILAIFDPTAPIHIFTDACLDGVGAVLKQPQLDNTLKPVFYFSRKLTNYQKTKKAIYIECLAIKEAILYWQYYLIGQKFIIFSDHKPLENFNIKKCNDPDLRQILNFISQFDFEIVYKPGRENLEADCLSRNPVLEENDDGCEDSIIRIVNFLKIEEIVNDQKQLKPDDKCEIRDTIIYKTLNNRKKIWLSEEFGVELIKKIHNKQGHIGIKQLTFTITKFYFKNMHKHIKLLCRSCDTCIKNKSRIPNHKAPLSQFGPASKPFEIISLDTIGGFAGNKSTKKYLHLITDHFTRYAFIATSKTQTATDFIKLVKSIVGENEIDTLFTDQYAGINSKEFKQYLKSKKIKLVFTAVDCAFSNGLNERTNQTLVNRIRCKTYDNKNLPWTRIAQECVNEYNSTIHSSTGFTPIYLLSGKDDSFLPEALNPNRKENLKENRRLAFENSQKAHIQNKKYYDKNKIRITYNEGDLVLIQNSNKLNRNKLDPFRTGPYRIKRKISDLIYIIDSGFKKKESNFYHASKLLPYPESKNPNPSA